MNNKSELPDQQGYDHYPVMHQQVVDGLALANKKVVVDCTVGGGHHARYILQNMGQDGYLIGLDKDAAVLPIAQKQLEEFEGRYSLVHGDFFHLADVLDEQGYPQVDAFLFDLGISMYQLRDALRGFSFLQEGPLDMRMNRDVALSAYDLVNNLTQEELAKIFKEFGEERFARRIARGIIRYRENEPIASTTTLAQIIIRSIGRSRGSGRIHPATRVFQALRIAVNHELDCLRQGLQIAFNRLHSGGRIVVISFHSLEDRITKHMFRTFAHEHGATIITKKPLTPLQQEVEENSPSRSAKLRIIEKSQRVPDASVGAGAEST